MLVSNEDRMRKPDELRDPQARPNSLELRHTATRDDPPSGRWLALIPSKELDEVGIIA